MRPTFVTSRSGWAAFSKSCYPTLSALRFPMETRRGSLLKDSIMPIGTVKFFNADKGYGFIAPEDGGNDAFVHISAVEAAGMSTLKQDQRVGYDLAADKRGKMAATNLRAE